MSWGKTDDRLVNHPKIKMAAADLGIPRPFMVGYMVVFWAAVRSFAEDGDLSRMPDDEIAALAEFDGDPSLFVQTLQKRRLLDDKLVHDWLDYNGEWLRTKYKTRKRHVLVAIWAKHGKVYGGEDEAAEPDQDRPGEREQGGNRPGTGRERSGNPPGSTRERQDKALDQAQDQEVDKALSPPAQDEKETQSPNGGSGGESGVAGVDEPQGSLSFRTLGLRAQGLSPPDHELPCDGFSADEVFLAFEMLFKFHGIHKPYDLQRRASHCNVTPSRWTMVFLDKIDVSYREIDGVTLVDSKDADPVGMTVSGLRPFPGKEVHTPTEAARGFFIEAMQDSALMAAGMKPRNSHNITAGVVTLELSRRKGKRKRA